MDTPNKRLIPNQNVSRLLIYMCYFLVMVNAITLGILLYVFNWIAPIFLIALIAITYSLTYFFYKKLNQVKERNRIYYLRLKGHRISQVMFYTLIMSFCTSFFLKSSIPSNNVEVQPIAQFIIHNPQLENLKYNQKKPKSVFLAKLKHFGKQIKEEIQELRNEVKSINNSLWLKITQITLTTLTVAVGLFLGFWVTKIANNVFQLGCEGFAGMILFWGWAFIIVIAYRIIKNIYTKMGKGNKNPDSI